MVSFVLLSFPACAESGNETRGEVGAFRWDMTLDEIARELSNPATSLRSFSADFEYSTYQGDLPASGSMSGWKYEFTPSFPIPLDNGRNILLRGTFAFWRDQPVWETWPYHPIWEVDRSYADFLLRQSPQVTADSGRFFPGHDHVADASWDVAYGGTSDSGFISLYGIAGVVPISTDISASRDQWLLGPEIALGKVTDWGVFGAWATHQVDVGGDSGFSTCETSVKVFFAYGLGNGWQVVSNPVITYDWEADSGNHLLLPIGGGVAKTLGIGGTPLKMAVELQYYVASPDRFGTEWQLTFSFTPVFSNPLVK